MQQTSRFIITAVLTLGLCLVAGPAWASYAFNFTNDTDDTIKVWCTNTTTRTEVSSGSSQALSCSGTTAAVKSSADEATGTTYTVTFDCSTGEIKSTSVDDGSGSEELALASVCASSSS